MVTRKGSRLLRFGEAGSKAISSMFFGRAPDAHMPTAQAIGVGLFVTSLPRASSGPTTMIKSIVLRLYFPWAGFPLPSLTRAPPYFSRLTTGLAIY
jgi:hypothetical protein